MLTTIKPVQFGYRSAHDLPTPPSTSRPSPPLPYQESSHPKGVSSAFTHPGSPPAQLMSAPHRPLPPPMAMAPLQPLPGSQGPPVSHAPPPPASAQQSLAYSPLPPPPPWQQEESLRTWLMTRAEEEKRRQQEEKRRQEEEKTRQESYRLEQRRMEYDILRASLSGGIPPSMVPVVFAGMGGGGLSQVALEWAQQYVLPQAQHQQQQQAPQHPPALMPPGPISPDHQRRDSQPALSYSHYPTSGGVPSTPGSGGGPSSAFVSGYPGSPRGRGQSMSGPMGSRPPHGAPANLPSLNTNVPGNPGAPPSTATAHSAASQPHQQQQETQSSSSLYFHHWQPPTNQGGAGGGGSSAGSGGRGGTEQPGESPRKRKAVGPQQPAPPPSSSQRFRSPTFSQGVGLSNPPPGRRRGHSRQGSDFGPYRGRGRGESFGRHREASPMHHAAGFAPSREGGGELASQQQQQHHPQQQQQQQQQQQHAQAPPGRSGAHSVSSLLSDLPPSPRGGIIFAGGSGPSSDNRHQQYGEGSRRSSPRLKEENPRGGGSTATRANDND